MRFALLGDHPDGIALTKALIRSDRNELLYYCHNGKKAFLPADLPPSTKPLLDMEEMLADPTVDMVLVASPLEQRAEHLRRAVQAEQHVACLHPADASPDGGYEAGMIQEGTGYLLLPILSESLHPAIAQLRAMIESGRDGPIGLLRLIEWKECSKGELLLSGNDTDLKPCISGWDVLRALAGEVMEVSAITPDEGLEAGETVLLSGRFEPRGLFQWAILPHQPQSSSRLRVNGSQGEAELYFPSGRDGVAFLSWTNSKGELQEEFWSEWSPWPAVAAYLEEALSGREPLGRATKLLRHLPTPDVRQAQGSTARSTGITDQIATLPPPESPERVPLPWRLHTWQDAIRCLELDDAARRSADKRRSVQLEYPEASEEINFKGTMTLVGCALLWVIILLAILSRWMPWLGWVVGPVLFVFLVTQLLRWVIPGKSEEEKAAPVGEE